MQYKDKLKLIDTQMKMEVAAIDALESNFVEKEKAIDAVIQKHDGQWLDSYKAEYRESEGPKLSAYTPIIKSIQDKTRASVKEPLQNIKAELDDYFNCPVKKEFADRLSAMASVGLKMTRHEFDLMKEEATSYLEQRLLKTYVDRIAREEQRHASDGTAPATDGMIEELTTSYRMDIPDIDAAYRAFEDLERSVNAVINYYSGKNSTFAEKMPPVHEGDSGNYIDYIAVADRYFRTKQAEEFAKVMEKLNSMIPDDDSRPLTARERSIIDAIALPSDVLKHPNLVISQIKEASKADAYIASLFRRDSRYSKYVEE